MQVEQFYRKKNLHSENLLQKWLKLLNINENQKLQIIRNSKDGGTLKNNDDEIKKETTEYQENPLTFSIFENLT